ncbi:hypothetical protein TD95_002317 [Thielaviopsis punctulata]|uniref:Expansin-like EG45 domain-containing protein n=1 Tax=Thielaviopsis punctulata TaxID=72032 RepID=A0A0F4ZCZ2_9PEZI|nr:hypothetical protein TD95_002317 [Thielaviopsis punctulata]
MRVSTSAAAAATAALAFGQLVSAAPQKLALERRDGWSDVMSSLKHFWGFHGGNSESTDNEDSTMSTSTSTVVVSRTTTVLAGAQPTEEPETTISMHSTVTSVVTMPFPTATDAADKLGSDEGSVDPTSSSTTTTTAAAAAAAVASATAVAEAKVDVASSGQDAIGDTITDGEATYYGGNLSGGTCSFTDYTIPNGLYGLAYSLPAWDDAANCGACVRIKGPSGNEITAMVVDACGSCEANHLDLFPDAFSALADKSLGIIDIDFTWVKCGIDSPIVLHNKDGVSEYWFSMQVVNSNEPVTALEVSTDGGSSWQATARQEYNFFENSSGFGTATVDVRVTSQSGKTITVNNVKVASDARTTGTTNF